MLPKIRRLFSSNHSSVAKHQLPSSTEHISHQSSSSNVEEANFYTETFLYTVRVAEITPPNRDEREVSLNASTMNISKRTTASFNNSHQLHKMQTPRLSTSARQLISPSNPFRRLNNLLRAEYKSNQSASSPVINETPSNVSSRKKFFSKANRSCSVNPDLHEHDQLFPPPPPEFLSEDSMCAKAGRRSIRVYGPGLNDGFANKNCYFDLIASVRDLQLISIAIDGPSKAGIHIESVRDNIYRIHYKCLLPGNYKISISYDGEEIDGSPYHLLLRIQTSHENLQLSPMNQIQAFVEPIEFDMNKPCIVNVRPATPCNVFQVYIQSSKENNNLPIIVHKSARSEAYEVYFIPSESGCYWLHVHLNYAPMISNPIRLIVRRCFSMKPMFPSKETLFHAHAGELSQFFVSKLPSDQPSKLGYFSAGIDGPSPISLDANETEYGYEFQCRPVQSGRYAISIRNGDKHIQGSPLSWRVDGRQTSEASAENRAYNEHKRNIRMKSTNGAELDQLRLSMCDNASKVCVFGTGLYEANKKRKASFKIDASQAGPGLLLVGLQSSLGSYERVAIKNIKASSSDFIYKVSYRVNQCGQYLLSILYGPNMQHVPGSPYLVLVE